MIDLDTLRVADVVREMAQARPTHAAVRHRARTVTYAQLDERSNRLAQALRAAGAGPGSRVAHLDRSAPEVVELLVAAAKLGAVAVPLNWRLAAPELTAVVATPARRCCSRDRTFAEVAAEVAADVRAGTARRRSRRRVRGLAGRSRGGRSRRAWRGRRSRAADVHVRHHRRAQGRADHAPQPRGGVRCTSPVWSFDAALRVSLTPLPMFHIGGIGWTYLALSQGATTILVSEFDAATVLDLLESERVTNAVFVPTILQLLCAVPSAAERDFSALRSIAYGASPITTPVLKAALRTFDCELFGVYGLTETTGGVVLLEAGRSRARAPAARRPAAPGRAAVVDPRASCAVVDGEVWLRGPNVMAGYANRPAETAAALTDDGWLRTGDGGYLDDEGYLFLTDRIKDMIVTGGENVYPIEVEEALCTPPGGRRRGRDRRARRALGRDRQGARRGELPGHVRRALRLRPLAARRLQAAALDRAASTTSPARHRGRSSSTNCASATAERQRVAASARDRLACDSVHVRRAFRRGLDLQAAAPDFLEVGCCSDLRSVDVPVSPTCACAPAQRRAVLIAAAGVDHACALSPMTSGWSDRCRHGAGERVAWHGTEWEERSSLRLKTCAARSL